MTERITQSMLDNAIKQLNKISKCHYISNDAYGWSQLALANPNSAGGIHSVSNGNTKKELYYQIRFLLDWLGSENDKRNHIKSCTHRDCFNNFVGKQDRSVVHEYKNKFHCSACRQELTKKEAEKSHVKDTWNNMRKVFD